ncbi:hypothetical protein [Ichthyobacterium seriolicida]|nr:hypothetical protein [Ichthyobacterium seriolicida]
MSENSLQLVEEIEKQIKILLEKYQKIKEYNSFLLDKIGELEKERKKLTEQNLALKFDSISEGKEEVNQEIDYLVNQLNDCVIELSRR